MEAVDEVVVVGLGIGRSSSTPSSSSSSDTAAAATVSGTSAGIVTFRLRPSAQSVVSFKDGGTVRHGLVLSGSRASGGGPRCGDHIACVQGSSRNQVKFWSWKKEMPVLSCTTPEKLGPLTSTRCGSYVAGGGASGTIYLWELSSGTLVRTIKAHYLAVTCLRFLDDDSSLVSGSEDAIIKMWNVGDLLDGAQSTVRASMTFSDHTLPVTDLWVGSGGFGSRVMSTSLDHTLKLWLLHASRSEERSHLVRSVLLPCAANCVAADGVESMAFVGGNNGAIYQVGLRLESKETGRATKRARMTVASDVASSDVQRVLEGHSAAVTCLVLSCTGLLLVSGSLDGSCRLWDTHAGQAVKVVSMAGGARPVLALQVAPIPFDVAKGHANLLSSAVTKHARNATVPPLKPLHRYQTDSSGKAEAYAKNSAVVQFRPIRFDPVMANLDSKTNTLLELCSATRSGQTNGTVEPQALGPLLLDSTMATPSESRIADTTARVQQLESENADWKRINSKLYAIAVDKFLTTYVA